MKRNLGKADRIFRLVAGALIAVLLATGTIALSTTLGIVLLVVSVIFLFTGIVNWCAIYALLGVSTCPVEPKEG